MRYAHDNRDGNLGLRKCLLSSKDRYELFWRNPATQFKRAQNKRLGESLAGELSFVTLSSPMRSVLCSFFPQMTFTVSK